MSNPTVRPTYPLVEWHVLIPPAPMLPSVWRWTRGQWEAGGATLTTRTAYRWGYRYGHPLTDTIDATILRDTDLPV